MKNPMLPVIFIIGLMFFSGTIFLYNSGQSQGMVLGENDYNLDIVLNMEKNSENGPSEEIIDFNNYGFPESDDKNIDKEDIKFPIIPQKKENIEKEPELVGSGTVIDVESGKILFEKNSKDQVSIASISKLANALVFLDQNPNFEDFYKIKSSDILEGGRIYMGIGEEVTLKDLFHLSLVSSDNSAAKAMAEAVNIDEKSYVEKMNLKMKELGLENTGFVDPVGLSQFNVSNAVEVAKLANFALSDSRIKEAVSTPKYTVKTKKGRMFTVYNTDNLLSKDIEGMKIIGGKTGYINAAGYCFVGKFINDAGNEIVSVVLGSNGISYRFEENEMIAKWAYNNYIWK